MSKKIFLNCKKNKKNSLTNIKASSEYIQNQKQIDCITNVLIKHADVPPKLIDWLIESVQRNTTLECKIYNKS